MCFNDQPALALSHSLSFDMSASTQSCPNCTRYPCVVSKVGQDGNTVHYVCENCGCRFSRSSSTRPSVAFDFGKPNHWYYNQ